MFCQVSWRTRLISPSPNKVEIGVFKPPRLFALLCLPYLLLSICNPFLHTCVDSVSEPYPSENVVLHASISSSESAQVFHTTRLLRLIHHPCAACMWAKNAIGNVQLPLVLSTCRAAIPFVLTTSVFHIAATIHFVQPRAPPIG